MIREILSDPLGWLVAWLEVRLGIVGPDDVIELRGDMRAAPGGGEG